MIKKNTKEVSLENIDSKIDLILELQRALGVKLDRIILENKKI